MGHPGVTHACPRLHPPFSPLTAPHPTSDGEANRPPEPEKQHTVGPPRTHPARRAPRLPTVSLPLQVLGCGTGSAMVLGTTWEDSGLSADSSAASGLGRSPSVTDRADRRGVSRLQAASGPNRHHAGLSRSGGGSFYPPPSTPRERKLRFREGRTSGQIRLTANRGREGGGGPVCGLK